MKQLRQLILVIFTLMLAACAGTGASSDMSAEPTIATDADLEGHSYDLIALNGEPITNIPADPARQPFMKFDGDMGIAGKLCNNFTGSLSRTETKYQGEMAATRMACFDQRLTQAEAALFSAFSEGAELILTGSELSITHGNDTLLFQLNDEAE
jgi:heat shock protein HslJ